MRQIAHRFAPLTLAAALAALTLAALTLAAFTVAALALAATPARAEGVEVSGSVFAHDQGPDSDHGEHGVDANLEFRFPSPAILAWAFHPHPHVGATISLNGQTSAAYGGLTWIIDLPWHLFTTLAAGLALHNGPLHAPSQEACATQDHCGFGSRVLFRGAFELGYRLSDAQSVSVILDHMSQGHILASQNEGIDNIGLRYTIGF